MKKEISIRNIYYLLSYAWEFAGRGEDKFLGNDTFQNTPNLMARLLDVAIDFLVRRGLRQDYVLHNEQVAGVRGKLLIDSSVKTGVLFRLRTNCAFDEHTYNNILNQVLKSTVHVLLAQKDLASRNALALRKHLARFSEVETIDLTMRHFETINFHAQNRHYRFAIELCKLIYQSISLSSHDGVMRDFWNTNVQESKIFEAFVRNFYSRELVGNYEVRRESYKWAVEKESELFAERVPDLNTDISIIMPNEVLVIDAKYYAEALAQRLEGARFKYRRDHLSQLMDYLRVAERHHTKAVQGMLLYPTVDQEIDDDGVLEGYRVKIATIDLSLPWESIHKKLLEVFTEMISKNENIAAA